MSTLPRAAGVCLAALLTCAHAAAQPNQSAQPASAPTPANSAITPANSELQPPVPISSTDVPYPESADGDATVLLELIVEKDGSVSSATVVEGVEPFAERARSTALTWRFTPAQRDHQPIKARIRARVLFHRELEEPAKPAPVALGAGSSPLEPAVAGPRALPEPAVEITVVGERREIGQTTLSKSDVREMPGAFGDAFRAIEALPGVAPLVSGIPYFYVRGAPPNNAGYFVDGVRVPLLFHLGLAQSVIHPGLIDHVDFFSSAAPASYGGYAGPIIAGQTRAPASAPHGEANLRLVDAGALLEAPFAKGRGTALVAGRYGYPGPALSIATDDMKIGYSDYQARLTWNTSSRDTLGLFAFGSHDYLATRPGSGGPDAKRDLVEQFVSDFHRLDLRYDHGLSEGRVRVALTGGYDRQGASPSYMSNLSLGARLEIEQKLGKNARFRGGAFARFEHYSLQITAQGPHEPTVPQSAYPPPTNLSGGIHGDVVWRIASRVELVLGARVDLYASSRHNEPPSTARTTTTVPAVDPRLSTRVTLSPGVAWLSTIGLSHQYPSLRVGNVPGPMLSIPGFPFGDRQLQSAAQASQGVELALPADLVFSATGFYSQFWGLTDLSQSCFQLEPGLIPDPMPGERVPPYVCPNNDPVRGRAYGLELLLRRPFSKRLSGLLSYTLSRATREAHFLTTSGGDDLKTVTSEFDRTHVLNAVLSYDLGQRWRVGSRFLFYTGTPYSNRDGSLPVPPYNAYRNPAFYRVDFRLEKRWRLGHDGSIAFVLEGQNVTLSKEISGLGLDCEGQPTAQGETTTCKQSTVGPLTIPSVGVEAFF
ncbi:MAG TPA: TonB-dependent receptor [Polyangiaceae bacterium]|nr:TonB-dependent receptor [Polyangiaceae bacterium]